MTTEHTGTSYAELNAVLDQASRPSKHSVGVPDTQLLGLQQRWTTALSARLDEVLEASHPEDGVEAVLAVVDAWRHLAADLATLRAVLDTHEPRSAALARARSGEYRMLAVAARLVDLDAPEPDAVRAGRALHELIRFDGAEPTPQPTPGLTPAG